VEPGFGGQSFMDDQLGKIREIRAMIDKTGRAIDLEVDGGINPQTAKQAIAAGATVLVAGSAVFTGKDADYAARIAELRGS
jgi:ribulose-phosphate 3-epimerase